MLAAVRKKLESYAERGFFTSYEERPERGRTAFCFVWLQDFAVTLVCDPARHTLTLRDVFPKIEPRSELDADLRRFVRSRHEPGLSAPRRIDPKRAESRCVNRAGNFSITLDVKSNHYRYATTKLVGLAQELFNYLSANHFEYMWENFDLPEE